MAIESLSENSIKFLSVNQNLMFLGQFNGQLVDASARLLRIEGETAVFEYSYRFPGLESLSLQVELKPNSNIVVPIGRSGQGAFLGIFLGITEGYVMYYQSQPMITSFDVPSLHDGNEYDSYLGV